MKYCGLVIDKSVFDYELQRIWSEGANPPEVCAIANKEGAMHMWEGDSVAKYQKRRVFLDEYIQKTKGSEVVTFCHGLKLIDSERGGK